jgi:D-amino-acid dehydrogenase
MLDAAQCRAIEPGLAAQTPLHAGIHLPDDEVGNCRQFALLLRREAEQHGVRFVFDTLVQRIEPGRRPNVVHLRAPRDEPPTSTRAKTAPGEWAETRPQAQEPVGEAFDAVVVCAALGSRALLRPLGLKLPLQAVYGYSVTAPLRQSDPQLDHAPRSALMDERYKVAISRLGDRIRIAGSAELGGAAEKLHPRALGTLYKVLDDWFPGAAQMRHAQIWKGARPMLPDGPPVLGASGIEGVWLNLGHGSSGWALSCGSARLLADALAGRTPSIDVEGLGIERLGA